MQDIPVTNSANPFEFNTPVLNNFPYNRPSSIMPFVMLCGELQLLPLKYFFILSSGLNIRKKIVAATTINTSIINQPALISLSMVTNQHNFTCD